MGTMWVEGWAVQFRFRAASIDEIHTGKKKRVVPVISDGLGGFDNKIIVVDWAA